MTPDEKTPGVRRGPRWVPLLTLVTLAVAGASLSVGVCLAVRSMETRTVHQSFRAYTDARAQEIEHELADCVTTLQSLRTFFDSSERVEPDEFARFAGQLMTHGRAIAALEWAPRVRGAALGVEVGEPVGTLFPITYTTDVDRHSEVIGFDLGSDPDCHLAIARAGALGTAVMTVCSGATDGDASDDELRVFLAVRGLPAGHPAYLESEFEGVVLMVLHLSDVVERALERADDDVAGAGAFRLVLLEEDGRDPLLAVSVGDRDSIPGKEDDGFVEVPFEVGERRFQFAAVPSDRFLAGSRTMDPVLVATIALLLCAGLLAGVACYVRGVAQRGDRERDRLLRSVLTSIEEGVVVADRSGGVRFVNSAAQRMLGPIADSSPLDWPTVCGIYLADGETPCPIEQIPLIRAARGQNVSFERMFVRNTAVPDGIWVSVSGVPLLDESNELQGGIAVLRDVTARRQAEVEIRRLSSVVEQTADAVMVTNVEGVIVYVNPAFEGMTGFATDEALGRTPRILRSGRHAPEEYGRIWQTLRGGEVYRGTITNRRRDGSFFECEHTITPIRDDDDRVLYFVAVSRDVTEARKTEELQLETRLRSVAQSVFQPDVLPVAAGLDAWGACLSSTGVVEEFVDCVRQGDGSWAIVVAAAADRGARAVARMAELRAYVRGACQAGVGIHELVPKRSGRASLPDAFAASFSNLLVVCFDPARRAASFFGLESANGCVITEGGVTKVELVSGEASALSAAGVHREASSVVDLEPGDLLVCMARGNSEGPTSDVHERVLDVVRRHWDESVRAILERVREETASSSDGEAVADGGTLVLCRLAPAADVAATGPVDRADRRAGDVSPATCVTSPRRDMTT